MTWPGLPLRMESKPGLCIPIQFSFKPSQVSGGRFYCQKGKLMWSEDSGWMIISIWKNHPAKNNSSKSESVQKWTHPDCVITWGMSSYLSMQVMPCEVWEKPFGLAHFLQCEVVGVSDDLGWSLCWRHPRFLNHREIHGLDAVSAEYLGRCTRTRWAKSPRQPSSLF